MRRVPTALLGACLGLPLLGCGLHTLDRNAPGIADLHEPPKDHPSPAPPHEVEVPRDPGGHLVVLSYGIFAGIGGAGGTPEGGRFSYGLGAEVSLAKGVTRTSHPDALFYPFMEWGYGINLGLTGVRALGKPLGPLYAEAELRSGAVALAAGWSWAPREPAHGPQATLSFGPLYLRGTHELDLGTQVHVGVLIKGYSAWAWSQ